MKIHNKLTLAALALSSTVLAGCSVGYQGKPVGHSQVITQNVETCTVSVENSINLLLVGGTVTSNSFDDRCARNQISKLLLSADLSHDPKADADTKALALAIAGMDDSQVKNAIDNVASGLSPISRARVERNVAQYRESLKAQGAAEAAEVFRPQITSLQNELNAANGLFITVEKPDYCEATHYAHVTAELNAAFPSATVSLTSNTLENMGLSIPAETPDADKIKADLCFGSFMYVSASQGYGDTSIRVRDERFYQDQSTFMGDTDANRPKLNPQIIVGHIAQQFNVNTEYKEEVERMAALERDRIAKLEQERQAAAAAEALAAQEAARIAAAAAPKPVIVHDEAIIVHDAALRTDDIPQVTKAVAVAPEWLDVPQRTVREAFQQQQDKAAITANEPVCKTVLAEVDTVRSHAYQGGQREFVIEAGNIDHFVCPADNGQGVKQVFVAANYAADQGEGAAIFTNGQAFQDRPSTKTAANDRSKGLLAMVKSWIPTL